MEEVLKGLQGKSLTKKKLFDFLADINLEEVFGTKAKGESIQLSKPFILTQEEPPEEFRCEACMKTFATKSSLTRHHNRFTVCKDWISLPQKPESTKLTKGIHLIVDEILDRAIGDKELECKFCKTTFINKGNHHKHYNYSTVCNRMAYQEFKKLFNEL